MDLSSSVRLVEGELAIITPMINNVVVVILIFLMGFIAGKILGRVFFWVFRSLKVDDAVKRLIKRQVAVTKGVSAFVSLAVYVATVCLVLETMGILQSVVVVLASGIFLIMLLSLIGGMKDFLPNFLAGFKVRKEFREGDFLLVGRVEGKIKHLGLLQSELVLKNGDCILVPYMVVKKKMPQHRGRV